MSMTPLKDNAALDAIFGKHGKYNDPFLLHSNSYIPDNWYSALDFALYIAIHNPVYMQAATRTVSHFLTDIAFVGEDGDRRERDDFKEYMIEELGILEALRQAGTEVMVYGNSFARVHYPFDRYLVDRRNGRCRYMNVKMFGDSATYDCDTLQYCVPDPAETDVPVEKRSKVKFEFIDRRSHDRSRIRIRFLDPKRMMLSMNYISGTIEYVYRFHETFVSAVKAGNNLHQVNETPKEMLQAIKENKDFKFNPGHIYHFRNNFVSGLSLNGWGIPNVLLNYNSIHQIQVLRCINEAVGLDYLLPIRLISPAHSPGGAGADAMAASNMAMWRAAMDTIIKNKRKKPDALFSVPFPVNYQEVGQGGKGLAPVDLIKYHQDEMLEGFGIPAEYYHMSLAVQQIPSAVRVFEGVFGYLYRGFNNFVKWCTKDILDYLEQEQMATKLIRPSIADDLEKKHVYLQLASGGELSRETAYRAFNVDNPIEEARKRMKEDIEIQKAKEKENQKFEREMQLGSANQVVDAMVQAQAGPPPDAGGAPGGPPPGPPGGPGGGGGTTPLDIEQQAMEMAQQFLQIPDQGERSKAMASVRASNPTLYAVIKQKMEEMRSQGASQGRKSVGGGG